VYKSVFKGYRLSLRSVCSRFTLHKIHEHCLSFMQKMQQTDCSNPVINKPSLRNPGTKKQNKRKRAPQTKRRGGEGKTNKKKTRKEGPKRPNSYIYIYMYGLHGRRPGAHVMYILYVCLVIDVYTTRKLHCLRTSHSVSRIPVLCDKSIESNQYIYKI
jgi:hypothetical protein